MTIDPSDVQVLVPGPFGALELCSAVDLLDRLVAGATLDDALGEAAIDQVDLDDLESVTAKVAKVRALNETGDAGAYWNL